MTATKKAGPKRAGQGAALPAAPTQPQPPARLAPVIPLPSALAEPVVQHRRRGRHPKEIALLWRERLDRMPGAQLARLEAQRELAVRLRKETFARQIDLRMKADALRAEAEEIARAHAAAHDQWHLLDAEVKRLEAEQAELLRLWGRA